jgi:hypothetical protein
MTTIQDSYFRNYNDIVISTMYFNGGGAKLSPKTTVIRNSKFGPPVADGASAIAMAFTPRPIANLVQQDRVFVYDFNRERGNSFQVFYREQAPDFVIPAAGTIGKAQAGLSNQVNWQRFGQAIAGQIATCTATRPQIAGFVCPSTDTPEQSAAASAPSAPRNVKLIR